MEEDIINAYYITKKARSILAGHIVLKEAVTGYLVDKYRVDDESTLTEQMWAAAKDYNLHVYRQEESNNKTLILYCK